MFALALTDSEILQFKMLTLKSRSRSLGVNLAMVTFVANIKMYKVILCIFALALTFSEIYQISNCVPSKCRSWSRSAIFECTIFHGKCQNLQMYSTSIALLLTSQIYKFLLNV